MKIFNQKIKLFIIRVLIFLVLWFFLELVSSYVYKNIPSQYLNGKRIVELNLDNSFVDISQSITSHPYLLYVNTPNYIDSVKQHNSFGYRSPEFKIKKDTNTIRVLTLGGSTTYGYLNRDPETTWPAQLQRKLKTISNKKVEVINAGLNYATSAELLASYMFRHRYLKPDILIFHEGGNDVAPILFPNYNPEYTHFRSSASQIRLRSGEYYLLKSNVFKLIYTFWLNKTNSVYKDQPYSFNSLKKDEVVKRVHNERNYYGFKRNIELLSKLASIDSTKLFFVGFLNASNLKISSARPDLSHIVNEIVYSTNMNNKIMKEISYKNNFPYIEFDKKQFNDLLFIDNCHLNPKGEEIKAKIIFNKIKKTIFELN